MKYYLVCEDEVTDRYGGKINNARWRQLHHDDVIRLLQFLNRQAETKLLPRHNPDPYHDFE